jgi:hypothetical protein
MLVLLGEGHSDSGCVPTVCLSYANDL